MADELNLTPGVLGAGDYTVMYRERCDTDRFLGQATITGGTYGRVLNEVSSASIEVSLDSGSPECCGIYSTLNPWQHELAIFRNGVEVWCGPIVRMELDFYHGKGTVEARDLFAWTDKRLIELADTDYEVESADIKDVFEWVLNHAYCKDPWCMSWNFEPVGIPIDRRYPAYPKADGTPWGGAYPVAGEELRNLTSAGVDWTVVGRHMWGGSVQISTPVPTTSVLYDSHWTSAPKIIVAGHDMCNRLVLLGGNGGYDGWDSTSMWVEPQQPHGPITSDSLTAAQQRFGLMEVAKKDGRASDIDTSYVPNSLSQAAFAEFTLTELPYTYIEQGTLSPYAPISIDALIPGARFDIRLTNSCRLVYNAYRLYNVDVQFSPGHEEVSVKFAPVGVDGLKLLQSE